jgi:uncharacterized protein YdaU (DUF1376 family)
VSLPYFPFYPSDYLGDTMHLSTEEHGAYLLLLITMWQHGSRLPNDRAKLARIARVPSRRWPAVWGAIEEYFEAEGDDIFSPRMREEYQKATSKSAVRSASGKAGAEAKALKLQGAASANATANASRLLKHTQNSDIRDTSNEVSVARERAPKPSRSHRLSADWTLPDDLRDWAIEQGWPPPTIDAEAEKMRDWSLSSPNGAKKDWSAAWRNWMRNKPKFSAMDGGKHGQRNDNPDRLQRIVAAAAAGTSGKGWG